MLRRTGFIQRAVRVHQEFQVEDATVRSVFYIDQANAVWEAGCERSGPGDQGGYAHSGLTQAVGVETGRWMQLVHRTYFP